MSTFKVESGLQLLARLTKKRDIDKFYPMLFDSGPKLGEVVEIFGDCCAGKTYLLMDMIVQALIPVGLGGAETEVLIFHTDGNMSTQILLNLLKHTVQTRIEAESSALLSKSDVNEIFMECCSRFHFVDIYDATQLYVMIHNLENIFIDHPNISLLVFDTLTAYYWSEQGRKIKKMELYLKNIIKLIQKATKEYKSTIVYTRQDYFNSTKESIEDLEACCKLPTLECLNYRLFLTVQDSTHHVVVRSYESLIKREFKITSDCKLEWI